MIFHHLPCPGACKKRRGDTHEDTQSSPELPIWRYDAIPSAEVLRVALQTSGSGAEPVWHYSSFSVSRPAEKHFTVGTDSLIAGLCLVRIVVHIMHMYVT